MAENLLMIVNVDTNKDRCVAFAGQIYTPQAPSSEKKMPRLCPHEILSIFAPPNEGNLFDSVAQPVRASHF